MLCWQIDTLPPPPYTQESPVLPAAEVRVWDDRAWDDWLWGQVTNYFSFRLAWGLEQVTGNQEVGDNHNHEHPSDSLPTIPCTQLPPPKGPSLQRKNMRPYAHREASHCEPLLLRSSVAPAEGNLSERFSVAENRGWPNVGRWGTEGVRGEGWVKGRGHRVPRECAV